MIPSILYAALVFAVLVVVHEAGHFAMAKKVGVRVLRFSIGYPPKLFGFRRGETEYSIGATPFGGYVRMLGDEVGEEPKPEELTLYLHEIGLDLIGAARERGVLQAGRQTSTTILAHRCRAPGAMTGAGVAHARSSGASSSPTKRSCSTRCAASPKLTTRSNRWRNILPPRWSRRTATRAFPTQPLGKRVLIVLAGPLSNIIFAPILLTLVFMYGVPQLLPVVGKTTKDLPAAKAGLLAGDRIVSVNGRPMETWADFSKTVKAGDGSPIKLEIERQQNGESAHSTIVIKPTRLDQKTIYGTNATTWVIGVQPRGDEMTKRYGPFGAVKEAGETSVEMTIQMVVGIASIFTGSTPVREALGGPIMIAQMAGQEAHRGIREPRDVYRDAEPRARHHKSAAGAAARRRTSAVLRLRGRKGQAARTSLPGGDAPGGTVLAGGTDGVRNFQ